MSFLDFTGLQYFYNKYLKPIKPHAREETIKSYTVNEQGHVPDAQLVAQLKEENERLQEEVDKLNSSLALVNTADDTTDGSSFGKNFMASGTENYRKAAFFNKPEEDSAWQNVPTIIKGKRWLGYRQVYRMDNNRVLVTVLELYPVHGRRWNLFYNNGEWSSWNSITPS